MSWNKVCLSTTVCVIVHFRFRLIFIKVCIFFQQNAWTFLTLKRHNSFHNYNNIKSTQFCSQTSDFEVSTRSFKIQ